MEREEIREGIEFEQYHNRNIGPARALQMLRVLIIGSGAVGSHVAKYLLQAGLGNLVLIDGDRLTLVNLPRHVASRRYIGKNKAEATARTLRDEIPLLQKILPVGKDLEGLSDDQITRLIRVSNVVIAATGDNDTDRHLNELCREYEKPLIVPSMWPDDTPALGDILVVAWNFDELVGACFECLRPRRRRDLPMPPPTLGLEAQHGLGIDVSHVAAYTADLAIACLEPTARSRWLRRHLDRGENYFLIPRLSPKLTPTETMERPGCLGCLAPALSASRARRIGWLVGRLLRGR